MPGEPVQVFREGPAFVIRLHRLQARNAVDRRTALALKEAWDALEQDGEARVGILTGGDEVFSAGADLKDLAGLAPEVTGEDGPLGA